ncbi:MAG: hypothetical protein ACRDD7_06985 [Peptostreptococcaceae bacterium]
MKLKYILIIILAMFLSFIINCIPVIFIEIPIIVTVCSVVPIYVSTRQWPSIGLLSYIGTFLITIVIDYKAGVVFLFINGLLGIFIGTFIYYIENKYLICTLSGLVLSIGINGIRYTKDINSLESFIYMLDKFNQIELIVLSTIYSTAVYFICEYIYNKIINTEFMIE